ncbi:MAG: hypothetical protein M0019_04090 [Actinomycetota bacterium]|nr:hypothetical protein [Actinomycetota bacterium]
MTDRIANTSLAQMLVNSVQQDQNNLTNLQQLLATGNNISKPSDNPTQVTNLLDVQSALARSNQMITNAKDGLSMLGVANGAMSNAVNVLQQARSTLLSAGNSSLPPASIQAISTSLKGNLQALLGIVNTQYLGVAIFGGTSGVPQAYDSSGNYLGNSTAPTRTVAPGVTLPSSVADPLNNGTGQNMIQTLNQIATDLSSGSSANLQTDIANFDSAFSKVQASAGQVGSQFQEMTALSQQMTYTQQTLSTQLSGIQSVDVAAVTTQYQQAMSNYQVTLYATAQVAQPSLATYLH